MRGVGGLIQGITGRDLYPGEMTSSRGRRRTEGNGGGKHIM